MGCDIHFYVETMNDQGLWVTADTWDSYDDDNMQLGRHVEYKNAFYHDRCYDLFAILANVRNGYGFAGIDTGDAFIPIAEPRGVPVDACPEYNDIASREGDYGHSHSYLTVSELISYDWTRTTKKRGVVDLSEWSRWRDNGKPESWCGSVSGGNVRFVEPDAAESAWQVLRKERGYPVQRWASIHIADLSTDQNKADLKRLTELLGGGSIYCNVEWSERYYERTRSFWSNTMPRLLALGPPDRVRCCFYFDS